MTALFNIGHHVDIAHAGGGHDGGVELYEVKCSTPLRSTWQAGTGSRKCGGAPAMAGHLYAFGSTAEMRRVEVRGCRGRGKKDDPPFDHYTGRGRVAVHRGAYFDAIYNKKSTVVLVLVEAFGGIVDETMEELKRLQRRSTSPGAVDRTRYGRHRSSPHTFIVHHMQRLSAAAVLYDAKAIKKGAVALKQQACNVRPAIVVGAGDAAHAARGGAGA